MFRVFSGEDFKNADFSTIRKGPSVLPTAVNFAITEETKQEIEKLPDMKKYPGLDGKCLFLVKKGLEAVQKDSTLLDEEELIDSE